MTTKKEAKKDTSYTHEENLVEIDKKWNKVVLNKEKRQFIYNNFRNTMEAPLDAADAAYDALGPEVESYYLDSLVKRHGISEEFIAKELNRRDNGDSTALPTTRNLEVYVKLKKPNSNGLANERYTFYTRGLNKDRHFFTPWKVNHGTRIEIAGGTALGRKIRLASKTVDDMRDELRTTTTEFEILLGSCRNVGALLRKWPDAINYIPDEWKGNDIGKEIAPINMVAFDEHVKKLLSAKALIDRVKETDK